MPSQTTSANLRSWASILDVDSQGVSMRAVLNLGTLALSSSQLMNERFIRACPHANRSCIRAEVAENPVEQYMKQSTSCGSCLLRRLKKAWHPNISFAATHLRFVVTHRCATFPTFSRFCRSQIFCKESGPWKCAFYSMKSQRICKMIWEMTRSFGSQSLCLSAWPRSSHNHKIQEFIGSGWPRFRCTNWDPSFDLIQNIWIQFPLCLD